MKRRAAVIAAVIIGAVALGACNSSQANSIHNDVQTSTQSLGQLQASQPTPEYKWSQIRQTLISVEDAQAHTVQTTTFMFNQGVQDPIASCPSIGEPVASTTELTNPTQSSNNTPIGLADPTGVYSGPSTGTYTVCVSPNGGNYIQYWEGFVDTISGPAVWNTSTHSVTLTGPSTAQVKRNP